MRKYSKEHVGKTANKVPAVIAVVCFFVVGVGVRAQQEEQVPVIILYHTMPDQANELAVETQGGVVKSRYHLIPAIAATLPESVLERVQNSPNVRLVEPDFQLFPDDNLPNDPRFAEQWSLKNTGQTGGTPGADIDAPKAWDTTTGSSNVVVAVIDTGAQIAPGVSGSLQTHPDLAANLWTNPGEIPNDNIDNDGNGYVDDLHGWNFFDGESWLFYSASEDDHGTHVSGTIAAAGNNGIGITGVNWQAQLMILKFIGPAGGSTSDSILAIQYARDKGAKVINASWGGTGFSQALKDAVDACDCVFAAAAGNEETNTDTAPHYPSSFDSANLIAVAATDHKDQRASFTNYGLTSVDLGAPGVSILSTVPMNNYAQFTGTSMASPHIAGGAALVYSQSSGLTPTEVKARILNAVDLVPTLNGITVTGGRLNVTKALQQQPGLCTPPASGDWVISANCTLEGNATAPANVIVEENVALTIASGVALDISLSSYHLKIKKGAKVVVKNGGKIY